MTVTAPAPAGATPVSVLVPDGVLLRVMTRASDEGIDAQHMLVRVLEAGIDSLDTPLLQPEDVAALADPDPMTQAWLRIDAGGALSYAGREVVAVRDDAVVEALARGAKPSEVARRARISRAQVARMSDRVEERRAALIASGEVSADVSAATVDEQHDG